MEKFKLVQKPNALKRIPHKFYKREGWKGYFLLDEIKDNIVPYLFYDRKWREDRINMDIFK